MTREQQIDWLRRLKREIKIFMPYLWQKSFEEALDMAIKAPEQKPKSEWEHDYEILKAYSDGANNVLDKIRVEIEKLKHQNTDVSGYRWWNNAIDNCLHEIDAFKTESEE